MKRLKALLDKIAAFGATSTAQRLVLGLFVAQALFLAFVTHIGVPPDENNHIRFIEYYAHHSVSPILHDQTPTWSLGDKTREVDYVYHYSASFIARLLPGEKVEVYVLRVISVIVALCTMILLVRLLRRLAVPAAAITVSLAILTNLPMVLMVSAAVNNDAFVWLGYVALLLLTMRLWQKPRVLDLILLLNIVAIGGLVKRTLLPLCLVFGFVALGIVWKKWKLLKKDFIKPDWRVVAGLIVLVISSGLFIERVGGNLYQYGNIAPTCEQVQGEEPCEVFWANSRQKWLDKGSPSEENTWLPDGTKRDDVPISLPLFSAKWLGDSALNVVDIQTQGWGHKAAPPIWLASSLLIVMFGAIGYGIGRDIKAWQRGNKTAVWRLFAITTALFSMAVQLQVNYTSYLSHQVFGIALNGRYIIPALLVLVGLSCYYASLILSRRARQLTALAVIFCVVVFSGLFMMVRNSQLFTG